MLQKLLEDCEFAKLKTLINGFFRPIGI